MSPQTQSNLIVISIIFIISVLIFYRTRLKNGDFKSSATFMATITFGFLFAFALLFQFIPMKSEGIGANTLIIPILLFPITFVAAIILSLLVQMFEHRSSSLKPAPLNIVEILNEIENEVARTPNPISKPKPIDSNTSITAEWIIFAQDAENSRNSLS